ncbi:uncharacterized protein LOC114537738 [Dendronephthya gigantea]|uniref:uncharacterized protein LOC114537738 n=1 Tax=Dendronephthya gigantea TaxID=151771 RepID=UPI001068FBBE|nr:uncharacterized protein LOC114537738 [Dendronephthya gigantea]
MVNKIEASIDGGYSNWSLDAPCNVSCGNGTEIWRRTCDNPEPKYGGSNCSELGKSMKLTKCAKKPCPVDGNYGNWTKLSPCSATCGQGVEIWIRSCDNPPGKYGGNCSNNILYLSIYFSCFPHQDDWFHRCCYICDVVVILSYLFIRRKRRGKRGIPFYAIVKFSSQQILGQHQPRENGELLPCISLVPSNERASTSQETGTGVFYQNLTTDGDPIPGHSRGVVNHEGDYVNTGLSQSSWYDRLQFLRPLAIGWLRNAWGNVDEDGHHVYDGMQRVRQIFVPYDKLGNTAQEDSAKRMETNYSTYDTPERPPVVIAQCQGKTSSTTEIA